MLSMVEVVYDSFIKLCVLKYCIILPNAFHFFVSNIVFSCEENLMFMQNYTFILLFKMYVPSKDALFS